MRACVHVCVLADMRMHMRFSSGGGSASKLAEAEPSKEADPSKDTPKPASPAHAKGGIKVCTAVSSGVCTDCVKTYA